MMFIQGKFDFLNSLDTSYKDDLLTPLGELQEKHHQDIKMEKGPYLNTEYIGFYLDANNKALKSRKIRKAMNIGFDREKMILFLRNTIGFLLFKDSYPKDFLGMEIKSSMNTIQLWLKNWFKNTQKNKAKTQKFDWLQMLIILIFANIFRELIKILVLMLP